MAVFESELEKEKKSAFDFGKWLQKHKLQAILGGLGIFLLGIGTLSALVLFSKSKDSEIEIIAGESEQASEIFVHMAGAVEKPGLYKLDSDSRVNDALNQAGGLSAEADREWFNKTVNLAQKLDDGVKLYIPFKDEDNKVNKGKSNSGLVAGEQTSIFIQESEGKVNINTASLDQLDALSGIGPAYAQRIIDNRPYSSVEDIKKVPGIGEKTFEKIKDQITIF